jgi:hypothetical protein
MTEIINGPIREGCFVRLRNGVKIGPVRLERNVVSSDFPWFVPGIVAWAVEGSAAGFSSSVNVAEVLPDPFTAASEPSYEQRLWDDVAKASFIDLQGCEEAFRLSCCFRNANAFMAERAKRTGK